MPIAVLDSCIEQYLSIAQAQIAIEQNDFFTAFSELYSEVNRDSSLANASLATRYANYTHEVASCCRDYCPSNGQLLKYFDQSLF
jgi:hypothetical protein